MQKIISGEQAYLINLILNEKINELLNEAFLKLTDNIIDNLLIAEISCLYNKEIYEEHDYRKINKIFGNIASKLDNILEEGFDIIKTRINDDLNRSSS